MKAHPEPARRRLARHVPLVVTLSALLAVPAVCASQTVPSPDAVRVRSYEIDATFMPAESSMVGEARVDFTSTVPEGGGLVFFLHNELQVDSVLVDGRPRSFSSEEVDYFFDYSGKALRTEVITGPGSATEGLTVFYRGRFQPSNVRSPSDYMRIDAEGVFLRAYAYSLWFPVFLESGRTSHEVSVPRVVLRTPSDFHAVFLGSKVKEYEEGLDRVSEWEVAKVDLMHVQCTAQRFEVTLKGTIHAYHYPTEESRAAADRILAFT